MSRAVPAVLLILALSACTDPWPNVYSLKGLRVMAVRAEPPDLAPGQSTSLEALVVDPTAPARLNTLLWLACNPDPTQLDQPECAKYETLESFQNGGGDAGLASLPKGLVPLGMTAPAGAPAFPIIYKAPADTFANVPADDKRRIKGVIAVVLMLAIAEEPPARWPPTEQDLADLLGRASRKEVPSVLTIKRLRVSETPTPNHNPTLDHLRIEEENWAPGPRPVKIVPGVWTHFLSFAGDGAKEAFQDLDVDGNVVTKTESLSTSWFTTFGEFDKDRTVEGEIDRPEHLYLPYVLADVPDDRQGQVYAVLRDSRGGVDWNVRNFFICDPALPAPVVSSVEPTSGPPGSFVKLKGEHLDDLIDVRAGIDWLSDAAWDDAEKAYVGAIPVDAPVGELSLVLRGKGCTADPSAKFTVTAP
ncbi:MAG: hypothetical protein QM765_46360 [Myxococcales bacterium]